MTGWIYLPQRMKSHMPHPRHYSHEWFFRSEAFNVDPTILEEFKSRADNLSMIFSAAAASALPRTLVELS